jgi:hypothetical protein
MHPLDHDLIDFLTSPVGRDALDELAVEDLSDQALLPLLARLRERHTQQQAAALIDQARLRRRAVDKFPRPDRLLYIDEALEQASSRILALYRASRYARFLRVADLGCGIGADTMALATMGCNVLAVERDPLRARLAEHNVYACGFAPRVTVLCADWTAETLDVEAAFLDPSRRIETPRGGVRRVFGLEEMNPPLSKILPLLEHIPHIGVKAAPGIDHAEIPSHAGVEFISVNGEMKEAVLWFGALRPAADRTATLQPKGHRLDSSHPESDLPPRTPGAYLYEPDAAVIRAGLVRHLGDALDAAQIDPEIAYLTADRHIETPFARAWPVLRHGRFRLKTLNRWLREEGAGEVTLKKRGSPVEVDSFRRRLKTTPGGKPIVVFLTHALGQPWMVLAAQGVK